MFKLESYVAPLLMGYIDQYVKLRPEDFQLSLWGGDAVLSKLDLRLDAIERTLNLPITFKSGHIYELRIHVPWTKLGSEPVVITINTIECILKLRDSAGDDSDAGSTRSTSTQPVSPQAIRPKTRRQDAEDLPPGYIQSLINKIINNVNIVINNLILKFVEDDIVLSANVKSAECYSVNHDWARAFVELSMPELVLRKVVNFHDLTVCLDKRNADGKIELYQDPFVYRSSVTCRMHMIYDSLSAKLPAITKLNLLCDELNLSLTDAQVPMFFRLVELCVAIYYGTLEAPASPGQDGNSEDQDSRDIGGVGERKLEADEGGGEGWTSWAWSYVPQILPAYDDEAMGGDSENKRNEPPILAIGGYINTASVTFKLTEIVREGAFGPAKVFFKPCMTWHAEGIGMEILLKGLVYFNVQFGMQSTHIVCQGESLCGVKDIEDTSRNPTFLHSSMPSQQPDAFKSNSLFDPGAAENQSERPQYVFDHAAHLELFTESFGLQRFGCYWMDYIYTMDTPDDPGDGGSSTGSQVGTEHVREESSVRFLLGPHQIVLSSSAVQRVEKFAYCVTDHDYEPYSKPVPEFIEELKGPPSERVVQSLQEFIAKRKYSVTVIKPTVWIKAADLPQPPPLGKVKVTTIRKNKKSKGKQTDKPSPADVHTLPMLMLYIERFDFEMTSAMYPKLVVQTVSRMAAPSNMLLHSCHSHTHFKVLNGMAGLSKVDENGQVAQCQNVLLPWSGTVYIKKLLLPGYWKNPLQPYLEKRLEVSGLTVTLTKPQLLLLSHLLLTWKEKIPAPAKLEELTLLADIFDKLDEYGRSSHSLLQFSVIGIMGIMCNTPAATSMQGVVDTLLSQILQPDAEKFKATPLFHTNIDTSLIPTQQYFTNTKPTAPVPDAAGKVVTPMRNKTITVTCQVPNDVNSPAAPAAFLVQVKGMVGCLDPILFEWLAYMPGRSAPRTPHPSHLETPLVDDDIAESTSPLKNRLSQGSQSDSNAMAPTDDHLTQSASFNKSLQRTLSKMEAAGAVGGSCSDEEKSPPENSTWSAKLAEIFPVVDMMEVQVEVEHICGFVVRNHVEYPELTKMANIPAHLCMLYDAGELPDTLVICCPSVRLHSAAHKQLNPAQHLPIKTLTHSLAGEKLPWSVEMSDASIYSLHRSSTLRYLIQPASVSATVAVTTKYHPPTSDNITSLGLCLHGDINSVTVCWSKKQVDLLYDIVMESMEGLEDAMASARLISETLSSTESAPTTQPIPPVKPSPIPVGVANNSMRSPRPTSSSSLWEPADVVVTETSESQSISGDATPVQELEEAGHIKLSLWCQWTLPRFLWQVYSRSGDNRLCVAGELEDLNASVDVQDVYAKVKCKVGAITVSHLLKRSGMSGWKPGDHGGILLTCDNRISHNIQLIQSKLWMPSQQPVNLFSQQEKLRDKAHGFLNFTYTRALRKNVKKRIKKLHSDTQEEVSKKELDERGVIYLNEVCVNIHPCDVVVNCPVIGHTLSVFHLPSNRMKSSKKNSPTSSSNLCPSNTGSRSSPSRPLPLLYSSILPLLYINTTNFRVFVPVCHDRSKPDSESETALSDEHDVCMIHLSALAITPQADNPLPRCVIEKDLYRKAVHAGITHQPGSEIEDRQYQFDISALSLSTGRWSDLFTTRTRLGSHTEDEVTVQNPAVEWNNLTRTRNDEDQAHLIPVASNFDLRIVAVPAIVYHPSPTFSEYKQPMVVCGYSLEVNATSDMDFYVSVRQLQLGLAVFSSNISALIPTPLEAPQSMDTHDHAAAVSHVRQDDGAFIDSGVQSEISALPAHPPVKLHVPPVNLPAAANTSLGASTDVYDSTTTAFDWMSVTAFDMLLTAGKISLMVYSHANQMLNRAGENSQHSAVKSKSDLEWRMETQSTKTLSSYDSGLDSYCGGSVATSPTLERPDVIVPFLYAAFAQPHSLVSWQRSLQKMELSCYDIVLKGAPCNSTVADASRLLPEPSDYALHWIETRPGQPNAKTGIPPSLYTLTVHNFLTQPADISLSLERPLKLNISTIVLDNVLLFYKELEPLFAEVMSIHETCNQPRVRESDGSDHTSKTESIAHSQSPAFLKSLSCLHSVSLRTAQSVIAMETGSGDASVGMQISVSDLDASMTFTSNSPDDSIDQIVTNVMLSDFLMKTKYANRWRSLVGPFTMNTEVDSQWQPHSGPADLPSIVCSLDSGALQVCIGQEHILGLQALANHIQAHIEKIVVKPSASHEDISAEQIPVTSKSSVVLRPLAMDIKSSCDDLRAGDFTYITEPVSAGVLPSPNDITFSEDLCRGNATMSWCYDRPRVITYLHITPVPFNLPPAMDVRYVDEDMKVPCILQYWDVLGKCFCNYERFYISGNEDSNVQLTEVCAENVCQLVAAQVWRVLILHEENSEDHNEEREEDDFFTESGGGVEPLVSPLTLAASLRVDSAFVESLIPMLQCQASMSTLQLKLANHPRKLGKRTPEKLSPFQLSEEAAEDMEWLVLTVDQPALIMRHLSGQHKRFIAQVNASAEAEILEFKNLTMMPLFSPVAMSAEVTWVNHDLYPRMNARFDADAFCLYVGASTVHTLHGAAQFWQQIMAPDSDEANCIPLHHYLICNNTQEKIRIGQVETDESILIPSLGCHAYSWRTNIGIQQLRVSIEGCGGLWSEPVEMDVEGKVVRMIEFKGHKSTLLVKIKQMTGVQKQVVISGQVTVASRINQHLEVKLLTHKVKDPATVKEMTSILDPFQTLPTYVIEQSNVRAIKVRLTGSETPWSQEISVLPNKATDTRLVKIPLTSSVGHMHVWCHIFTESHTLATSTLKSRQSMTLLFTPLFVVRSHLPSMLRVNVETSCLKTQQKLEVMGQGHEEHLHMLAGDLTHAITFQLSSAEQASSPAISLSSGMIEQVPRETLKTVDVDDLAYDWRTSADEAWPYNHITPLVGTRHASSLNPGHNQHAAVSPPQHAPGGGLITPLPPGGIAQHQPNIDLQVTLTQRWPSCNTLLIDVSPNWLLVNNTDLDFVVVEQNDAQWSIPHRQAFAPPVFHGGFQLGIALEDGIHLSDTLELSEEEHTYRYQADLESVLYRNGHIKATIPIIHEAKVSKVCHLIIQSTMKGNMQIVTITNRYVLTNEMSTAVRLQCFSLTLSQEKYRLSHETAVTTEMGPKSSSSAICPLVFCSLPVELDQHDLSPVLNTNFVLYLTFTEGHKAEDGQHSNKWSEPCRVRTLGSCSRTSICIPQEDSSSSCSTRACVLTSVESSAITYLVLGDDPYPMIQLHNNCPYDICFGQTLTGVAIPGLTTQEEAEMTHNIPTVPAHSCTYYTFPAINDHFPELVPPSDLPKLHLAGFQADHSDLHWSHGIDLMTEHDLFVNIPEVLDVKAHIERVCHTLHIFIDPVSRAEISAKEIRSRIKGREKTVVVENRKDRSPLKEDESAVVPPVLSRSLSVSKEPTRIRTGALLMEMSAVCQQMVLVLLDEQRSMSTTNEMLRVTADSVTLLIVPNLEEIVDQAINYQPHASYTAAFAMADLQIDNQMYGLGSYDFPVVFVKQDNPEDIKIDTQWTTQTIGTVEEIEHTSLICVQLDACYDLRRKVWVIDGIELSMKPISFFIEDTFIYDILRQIDHFMPVKLSHSSREQPALPPEVCHVAAVVAYPIRLHYLVIQPTNISLSIHASLKLFIASDNTPLSFGKFERRILFTNSLQLIKSLAMHYASGALFRAGFVVGSLEILGNPTGLIRNIGTGVSDLFRMPYEGLTRGPGAFIGGVSRGMASLLKHISTGTLTSITNFASSVSRNMDRLSLDAEHQERLNESRRQKPEGISQGLKQGLTGFGISLLGAVAGIADQPLQSIQRAIEVPNTNTQRATGIVSGVGKGLVGAVTKPIGGAAELVSLTGMGLLHGVGLSKMMTPRHRPSATSMHMYANSSLKYLEKFFLTMPNTEMVMTIPAIRIDPHGLHDNTTLILTAEILVLTSIVDDLQLQAFAVSEIDVIPSQIDPTLFYTVLNDTGSQHTPSSPTYPSYSNYAENKDRVAAFLDGANYPQPETDGAGVDQTESRCSPGQKKLEFQVDARFRDLFIAQFKLTKAKVTCVGFKL